MIGDSFVNFFSKLPGVGLRSSKRIFFSLVQNHLKIDKMISVINEIREKVFICKMCNNISSDDLCEICKNDSRDKSKLCVVLSISDLYAIEESEVFDGFYVVMQKQQDIIKGSIAEFIKTIDTEKLRNILSNNRPSEIIIANNLTTIGSAQTAYIVDVIENINSSINLECDITSLASGMPIGSEIEYLDTATIIASMSNRKKLT